MTDPAKPPDPLLDEADAVHDRALRRLQDDIRLADSLERLGRATHSGPKGPGEKAKKLSDPLLYRVNAAAAEAAPDAAAPDVIAPQGDPASEKSEPEEAPAEDPAAKTEVDLPPIQNKDVDPRGIQDLEATYVAPRRAHRSQRLVVGLLLSTAALLFVGTALWLWTRSPDPTPTPSPPSAARPPAMPISQPTAIAPSGPSAAQTADTAPSTEPSAEPAPTASPTAKTTARIVPGSSTATSTTPTATTSSGRKPLGNGGLDD
jgi:hypothetical protein